MGEWHDRIALRGGCATTPTRASHWSSRGIRDQRMALWAGHFVDTPAGSVWFAGDTGYGDGATFRDVSARYDAPGVALIPIGAYEPRWFMAPQHVDPAEAARIARDVGARDALGIHWGTFRLTDESREAPRAALASALSAAGIAPSSFVAASPGQFHDFAVR